MFKKLAQAQMRTRLKIAIAVFLFCAFIILWLYIGLPVLALIASKYMDAARIKLIIELIDPPKCVAAVSEIAKWICGTAIGSVGLEKAAKAFKKPLTGETSGKGTKNN